MQNEMIQTFTAKNWILGLLLLYFFIIILTGLHYSKKVHQSEDLLLAGRSLTYPFLVSSILATWIGAGVLLGAAGEAFTFGMQGVIFDPFSPMLTLVLTGIFFAYRMRKSKYTTIVDFYERRFGKKMSTLFIIIQFLAGLSWMAGELIALGVIVHLCTPFSMNTAVIISTFIIITVILLGGLWALSRVDAISIVCILISLSFMFYFAIKAMGGMQSFIEHADNFRHLPSFALTPVTPKEGGFKWYSGILGFIYFLAAWMVMSLGDLNNSTLITRALAAKNEKTAVSSFITSGILYLIIGLVPVTVGMSTYYLYPDFSVHQAEMVLPWFANTYLPTWIFVLLILSISAVVVSGIGNNLLSAATFIGHNAYPLMYKKARSKDTLVVVRISIVIIGLLAMSIGLYFKSIYKLIVFAGTLLFPTTTVSYIGGMFFKKVNTTGAISSFIGGFITWIVGYLFLYPYMIDNNMIDGIFFDSWAMWDSIYIAAIPAFLVSLICLVVGSILTQKSDPPLPMKDIDGHLMDTHYFFWSKEKKISK